MIGSLGNIVFEISSERVRTFQAFRRKRSADFAEHDLIDKKSKLQFMGPGLDEITFQMTFSAMMGLNPKKELKALNTLLASGECQTLVIGADVIGKFVITGIEEDWNYFDGQGRLWNAGVSITLKEWADGN